LKWFLPPAGHQTSAGNWNDHTKWPGGIPATGEDVNISVTGSACTVTVNTATNDIGTLTINSPAATLSVPAGRVLNATDIELQAGAIKMGGTSTINAGTLDLATGTTLTGAGTLALTGAGLTGSVIVTASGTLDIQGVIANTVDLAISCASAADLKIDGTAQPADAIGISSTKQTLEVGSGAHLTIGSQETVSAGTIKLDGGNLVDSAGIVLDSSAKLTGAGTVDANLTGDGTGTVKASGGTLDLTGSVSGVKLAIGKTLPRTSRSTVLRRQVLSASTTPTRRWKSAVPAI